MAKLYLVGGWVVLAFVVFATLAPIYDRPTVAPPHVEHFAAFFMLGLLFMLACPNRVALVLLIVGGSAVTLETLQLLTPDRHGRFIDASIKVAGGLSGMALFVLARVVAAQAKAKVVPRG
ncbi:VanZ like family protein [Bradyrhizobium sp. Ghvi]|uniref:VanZ family protein n=1 Tax=Bradyrhizobium sp. Ghvi TaxID=1855319 RepID=UPI0008F03F14|nr:VanZ family protein [Bradyrhizobium sp. Ghvi]SFP81738.1 VanZ like family protein [Bradyrhizobium sp. Ghvi]